MFPDVFILDQLYFYLIYLKRKLVKESLYETFPSWDWIHKIADKQIGKRSVYRRDRRDQDRPVITLSREPGYNGGKVA